MRSPRIIRIAMFLIWALTAAGCQTMSPGEIELREKHLVSFNYNGEPITPRFDLQGWDVGSSEIVRDHYVQQVRRILRSARLYLKQRFREGNPARILVFIHGGLNDFDDSIDRLKASAEAMKADGIYPIFVSWNSNLFSSYFDNLSIVDGSFSIRRFLLSPLTVVRDLVTGLINIPARACGFAGDYLRASDARDQTAASVAKAVNMLGEAARSDMESLDDQLNDRIRSRSFVDLPKLPEFRPDGFRDFVYYSSYSPRNIMRSVGVVSSFMVDAFGKGAWAGMLRRTKRLFDEEDIRNIDDEQSSAGLSLLMAELRDLQSSLRQLNPDERVLVVDRTQQGLEIIDRAIGRLSDKVRDDRYKAEIDQVLESAEEVMKKNILGRVFDVIERAVKTGPDQAAANPDPKAAPPSRASVEIVRIFESARRTLDSIFSGRFFDALKKALEPSQDKPVSDGAAHKLITEVTDKDLRTLVQWLVRLSLLPREVKRLDAAADTLVNIVDFLKTADERTWRHLHLLRDQYAEKQKISKEDLQTVLLDLRHLVRLRLSRLRRQEVSIDIFAHSMGTIIVNEILRRSERFSTPNFGRIVYMAAACSIRDYEDSVFPYLFAKRDYGTQFHNVMLHPKAEENEMMFYDILPRGSLLVYIDEYLTNPGTRRDRTLGRFQNIMLSLQRTRPEVAGQIHMKVFSAGRKSKDQVRAEAHTEFAPAQFWKKEFWSYGTPRDPAHR